MLVDPAAVLVDVVLVVLLLLVLVLVLVVVAVPDRHWLKGYYCPMCFA